MRPEELRNGSGTGTRRIVRILSGLSEEGEASGSGLKIIGGVGAKGSCAGSPKANAPGDGSFQPTVLWRGGREGGPSSLERSTGSWCISRTCEKPTNVGH